MNKFNQIFYIILHNFIIVLISSLNYDYIFDPLYFSLFIRIKITINKHILKFVFVVPVLHFLNQSIYAVDFSLHELDLNKTY